MRAASSLLLTAAAVATAIVTAQTTCPEVCTAIYSPVCGSDGQTYGNECEFDAAKCQSGDASLSIAFAGDCPSASGSGSDSAGSLETSASSSGSAVGSSCAQEFACMEIYDPVCGSDGITYGNSCELKVAQCTDASITQVSTGECASTTSSGSVGGDANAGDDSASESESSSSSGSGSESGCSTVCTREYLPVCGSNGVTYDNSCLFDNAQCLDASLSVATDGACAEGSESSASSTAVMVAQNGLVLFATIAAVALQLAMLDGVDDDEQWRRPRQLDEDEDHLLLHQTVLASKKQQLEHQHERLAKQRAFIRHERRKLLLQHALLESERERFTASLASDWFCSAAFPTSGSKANGHRLALDVGGQLFEISYSVAGKDPESLLAALVGEDSPLSSNERGCFRVDRDWWLFRYILRFLRDGILPSEPKLLREMYLESEFWRFESLRKAIETRNMELLARRQQESDVGTSIATAGSGSRSIKDLTRRQEGDAAKAKARDPSAWWQDPPLWWGAPANKESAPLVKGEGPAPTSTRKVKEEPDAWWKASTYKGEDFRRDQAPVLSSERPASAAKGTPRVPLVVHSTWPSLTN